MNRKINELLQRIQNLKFELDFEVEKELRIAQEKFRFHIQKRKVRFEKNALIAQREFKKTLYRFFKETNVLFFLSSPLIYSLIAPLLLLDFFLSAYQYICFPLYGIKKVVRSDYVIIDRYHLAYLNLIEKINCAYCGYGNGLLAYALEIASRTEEFWCPIKHAKAMKDAHSRYHKFAAYGEAESYQEKLREIREGAAE